ncbi:FAD-binding domain-containing protein [Methylobacterium bullatum]|uniref:FAD-binding domain-containing protein n=1 Tax=Methylobacterium bullatum TaxID=570505 RepID=UPI001EE2FCE2|nr:FAD-binding domain-containing protein [Methylobacterium bullatum]
MDRIFPMTRAAGLERLAAFLEHGGAEYAGSRNFDLGPEASSTTSALSPYLRRRLITEAEVVAAVVAAFGDEGAKKFVSEVFWRTYFKGHLETHPAASTGYLALAAEGHERLTAESGLLRTYKAAVEWHTGIDCFDAWARELTETGWLHTQGETNGITSVPRPGRKPCSTPNNRPVIRQYTPPPLAPGGMTPSNSQKSSALTATTAPLARR